LALAGPESTALPAELCAGIAVNNYNGLFGLHEHIDALYVAASPPLGHARQVTKELSTIMSTIMLKMRIFCGQWLKAEGIEVSP